MSEAPKPPQQISGDGREIWDWAARFSAHTYRVDEMRRLNADIRKIGTRCGDCDKWMKSSQCPMEWNENGRQRGPSCEDTTCAQFMETTSASERRESLKAELQKIEGAHAAAK